MPDFWRSDWFPAVIPERRRSQHRANYTDVDEIDYELLDRQAAGLLEQERDLIANAANLSAFLYHELPEVNWVGFYFVDEKGLLLGPFAGKPACVRLPEGKGVCGAAVREGRSLIVDDVHAFADHIVCDSASASELVVPLSKEGRIFGVLDIDSPAKARFSQRDREGIERIAARFLELTEIPSHVATRGRARSLP